MITDREIIMAVVDNDCLTDADAAVLLEGDGFFRWQQAVDLYKQGKVSRIVFSGNSLDRQYGSYPFSDIKPCIINSGISDSVLIHEDKSLNTHQQAVEIVKMAVENDWHKLVLVASAEHQYRAYLTFLREILDSKSNIILYNAPVRNLKWFEDSGWGTRFERLAAEFERIEKYSLRGHLASVQEVVQYQKWKESLLNE